MGALKLVADHPRVERAELLNMDELRRLTRPNYWVPVAYLTFDWAVIFGTALAARYWSSPITYLLAALIIGGRQHALFVIVHEGVHKHLARGKVINDSMARWFAAFPVLLDFDIYRRNHLKHHEHLNTDADPDWVRKKDRKEWHFPFSLKQIAAYVPYYVFVWGPVEWGMIVVFFSGILAKQTYTQPVERRRFIEKVAFYVLASTLITLTGTWKLVLLYWLAPLFFVFPFAQRIRSVAEHFALDLKSDLTSSRDVIPAWAERVIISPHFVNFHLSHHIFPAVPCYNLPDLHEKLMARPAFAEEAHVSQSYLGLNSRSLLSDVTSTKSEAGLK